MDMNWLAEVSIPTDKNKWRICTGVPISNRYLLTSPHDVGSFNGTQIRFVYDVQSGNETWRNAQVAWDGREHNLDTVLLEFDLDTRVRPFFYAARLPTAPVTWHGAGFPAASIIAEGELKGHRDSTSLQGNFAPGGQSKAGLLELELTVKPKNEKELSGISGAPVLWNGRLMGIVSEFNPKYSGHKLSAVPIKSLLETPSFREFISVKDRQAQVHAAKNTVEEWLDDNSNVLNALYDHESLRDAEKTPGSIVHRLFTLEISDFTKTINQSRYSKDITAEEDEFLLDKVLNFVLPYLMDFAFVSSVDQGIGNGQMLQIPLTTPTLVEIMMAAVDGRSTSFVKPTTGMKLPSGGRRIQVSEQIGIKKTIADKQKVFLDMLKGSFLDEEDFRRNPNEEEIYLLIDQELKQQANKDPNHLNRYYYIYEKSDDDPLFLAAVKDLQKRLKYLIFLELEMGDTKLYIEEREQMLDIRDWYQARGD